MLRTKILATVTAAGALLVVAGCSTSTTSSQGTPVSSAKGSAQAGSTSSKASSSKDASLGQAVVVKGQDAGEQATVTLIKVVDPATSSDTDVDSPDAGKRYVAYELSIENSGTVALQDDVDNDLTAFGSDQQQYMATIVTGITAGSVIDAITLAPGRTVKGYSVVELPTGVKTASVQFQLDSGFSQFATWDVS